MWMAFAALAGLGMPIMAAFTGRGHGRAGELVDSATAYAAGLRDERDAMHERMAIMARSIDQLRIELAAVRDEHEALKRLVAAARPHLRSATERYPEDEDVADAAAMLGVLTDD